jgi:type 1 glutamine amidotransferase
MKTVAPFFVLFLALAVGTQFHACGAAASARDAAADFRVLVLTETGGHHAKFVAAARSWLAKAAATNGFAIDYLHSTDTITTELLARYRLFIQLDYVPYGWKPEAMEAFRRYIEKGQGGWIGFHHATLLGEFDRQPMWTWFSEFMGKIRYQNYIPTFASGEVRVESPSHPCMKGLPGSFVIPREEWYTYDKSPRANVRVLASVDEASYQPASTNKMGDHPVVWTNEHVAARNVYIFMGHGPELLENPAFTRLFLNSILWAAGRPPL